MLADRLQRVDTAPVELYRATDTIGARAEDDDRARVSLVVDVAHRAAIGKVEVVGLGGVFGCEGIDLLDYRHDAELLAQGAYLERLLISSLDALSLEDEAGDLEVREALTLGVVQQFLGQCGDTPLLA